MQDRGRKLTRRPVSGFLSEQIFRARCVSSVRSSKALRVLVEAAEATAEMRQRHGRHGERVDGQETGSLHRFRLGLRLSDEEEYGWSGHSGVEQLRGGGHQGGVVAAGGVDVRSSWDTAQLRSRWTAVEESDA